MFVSKIFSRCCNLHHSSLLLNVNRAHLVSRFAATETDNRKKSRPRIIRPKTARTIEHSKPGKNISQIDSDSGIPPYVEVDPCNSKMVSILTATKTRDKRYRNMMIMLEGKRLIADALEADLELLLILFSQKKLLKGLPFEDKHIDPGNTLIHYLPQRHIQTWSSLTTSPGIIGIFRMPNLEYNIPSSRALPITIVCDNIREPGNLGSILRVAAALPVEKVILLTGCVDVWEPKVTRGSCGAVFHLNIMTNASWEDVEDKCSGNVLLADHEISGDAEKEAKIIKAEDYYEDPEAIFNIETDDEDEIKELRSVYDIPSKAYHNITFTNDQSYVIIIGGESHGLSEESFAYAKANNGLRVNIPLATTISSLNSATALGIITFEMKRQLKLND